MKMEIEIDNGYHPGWIGIETDTCRFFDTGVGYGFFLGQVDTERLPFCIEMSKLLRKQYGMAEHVELHETEP